MRSFCGKGHGPHGDWAVFLSHDLSILRLIESFSESAPQLVLMLAVLLQSGQLSAAAGTARSPAGQAAIPPLTAAPLPQR